MNTNFSILRLPRPRPVLSTHTVIPSTYAVVGGSYSNQKMATNFPILRLPRVALSRIFNIADPPELVTLALCSKRAFYLVKSYRKNFKFTGIYLECKTLTALISDGTHLYHLIHVPYEFSKVSELFNFHSATQPTKINFKGNEAKMYKIRNMWYIEYKWVWPQDGFKLVIDWLTELFKTDNVTVMVNKSRIDLIGYVQNRQETLKSVEFIDQNSIIIEEDYRRILESKAQQVTIKARLNTCTFEYPPEMLPKREALILTDAYWFTFSHLMQSDYKHLSIEGSPVTQWGLNQFIKQWLMGRKERLKVLVIDMKELNFNVVFDGFREKHHRFPEKRFFEYYSPTGFVFKLKDLMFYIERDDGTIATVYESTSTMRRKFFMFVLPDYLNNTIKL